ncbi:MAG: monovalent cation/H(+) antiporter subunit G [Candidatus Thermoplasmatota archaeon]|nr:monovalent cation/H(+) antiporter subunit G [Candidatus Thermoplasmatota archaeon]MBU1941352.1 monovalent cation/H(+) antiporter subunit G [Candidatus Thermoplasmatota archaeon]
MFEIIIYLLLIIGVFFNLLGSLGLLRFPDVYTRLHAGTKCTTFGSIFLIGSVILLGLKDWYLGSTNGSILAIHAIVALVAILLTNPTGAHAIARAAHKSGVMPINAQVDHLKEDTGGSKKTTEIKKKEAR